MTRTEYPGGTYVDALPSGAFAMLVPGQHVQTHLGRVPLPDGDEPLYLRVTEVGGFAFAGQAHASNRTLEYWQGTWRSRAAACGVSPVIYDRNGILHISDCSQGSQGYRYVDADNRIWTGDETYGSPFGLSEWSAYGGLSIGQGHDGGGVKVWDGSTLRVLEDGDGRFIRVNGDGERVAIAFWKIGVGAVVYQTTLDELRALPPVAAAPLPTPVPVPQPPTPEPVPMPAPVNRLADVQRIRAKYPTPLGESHWRFLVEVCQAVGAQLYRKDGGDHVFVPPLNRYVSLDVIGRGALGDWWIDILGDAENEARPAWDAHEGAAGEYLDVSGIVLDGTSPPPQNPPPSNPPPAPSVDLSAILARLDVSDARTVQALSELTASVHRLIAAVEAQKPPVIDMTVTTFPDYRGAVPYLGTITLKPVK